MNNIWLPNNLVNLKTCLYILCLSEREKEKKNLNLYYGSKTPTLQVKFNLLKASSCTELITILNGYLRQLKTPSKI